MEDTQNITNNKPTRPTLLTVLCILTFIGSGISTVSFFMVSVLYEPIMEQFKVLYANMPEASFLLEAPRDFFVISFILSAASVAGAILMWNLRKIGFHVYTSSQIVYLLIPLFYFGGRNQ